MAVAFASTTQQTRQQRWPVRYACALRRRDDVCARCPAVRQLLDEAPSLWPPDLDTVLIRRAPPSSFLALARGKWRRLPRAAGLHNLILDAGELVASGFVMQLSAFRWDALGCVEALLWLIGGILAALQPGGTAAAAVVAEPSDYLASFVRAFPVDVHVLNSSPRAVVIATAKEAITVQQIESVVRREVTEERSHGRYADILRNALSGTVAQEQRPLRLLDVGGGDGHMAEWWTDMGCDVHLLEVDADCAKAAVARLGQERVALHDGSSAWPYADGSFDVCLLLFVLHHIGEERDLQRTLAEAARVSRRVFVLEDQPRHAESAGLAKLAVAVTAEHFRPFGQDPAKYLRNIRPDDTWRALFRAAGLHLQRAVEIPGTLQHPVPHTFYELRVDGKEKLRPGASALTPSYDEP
ncbi:unnamed protein product [Symbiodinium natans]|uniref:Methyltransferase type 11 domain-containing protein n=1 Tax=Symbiodinium natans TaxID=878477 RepID=A0A812Q423_9DINO|nr:unnamed protein product [Symbiodinium natans]